MKLPRARRSPVPPHRCHLAQAIEIIGDKWTLMILRAAMYGVRRFDDFQGELGVPRTMLSTRLKKLVEAGLLEKVSYREPGKRARPEYLLTPMGVGLRPILIGLTQWGDAWLGDGEGAPISFATRAGGPVHTGFVDAGGREVAPDQMKIVLRKTATG